MNELRDKISKSIDSTVDELQCLGAMEIADGIVNDVKEIYSHINDKLFITELINDLNKNGFVKGGRADDMLCDWSRELREKSRHELPASRLKSFLVSSLGRTAIIY